MDLRILLSLAFAALSAAQLTITVGLPAKPNPFLLPPSTHATLSSLHKRLEAPLTTVNTFNFHNVTADSYLLDVHCATEAFHPLRVDVGEDGEVKAWETYRGNEWANKGEEVPVKSEGGARGISVKGAGSKIFFVERPACKSLTSLLLCRLYGARLIELTDVLSYSFRLQHPQEPHDPDGPGYDGHCLRHAIPNGQQYVFMSLQASILYE